MLVMPTTWSITETYVPYGTLEVTMFLVSRSRTNTTRATVKKSTRPVWLRWSRTGIPSGSLASRRPICGVAPCARSVAQSQCAPSRARRLLASGPPIHQISRRGPRPRPGSPSASLQSDPDLLSFQQQLLTLTIILARFDGHGQSLVLDVAGMRFDGAREQAVGLEAGVDAVLDVEAHLLAPVLDEANDLARKPFQAQLFSDLCVQFHVGSAEHDLLDVQLFTHDRSDVLGQGLAWQRHRSERLANPDANCIPSRQSRLHRLPRQRHVGLDFRVMPWHRLGEVAQVDRAPVREVAIHRFRHEGHERGHQPADGRQRLEQRLVGGQLVAVGLRLPESPPRTADVPVRQLVDESLDLPGGLNGVVAVEP